MAKKYFVRYYKDFGNTYNLAWAETDAQIEIAEKENWEQITRKEAENFCIKEKQARKNDQSFSGYADSIIFPIDYNREEKDWANDRKLKTNGYIVEYI